MFGKMCGLCSLACALVVIGALNWGLVGLHMLLNGGAVGWNVVGLLLGSWPMVEAIVYLLVGIAGIYKLFFFRKCCGKCVFEKA